MNMFIHMYFVEKTAALRGKTGTVDRQPLICRVDKQVFYHWPHESR